VSETQPAAGRINHPVLLPEFDEETVAPVSTPAPKPRWYSGLGRPAAYVASALAGALLVVAMFGLNGSRAASNRGRGASDAAPGGLAVSDTALLDRRADTLALAISAFTMRASMYDSRRMPCSGLARGLTQVEDGWLSYNMARKDLMAFSDPARDARDKALYADVRGVEVRFERSSCARP
jgi:hypothetical protein